MNQIRQAVLDGDYGRARELWIRHATALARGGLTAESLAEAAELVAWSRPILTSARDRAVETLRVLRVATSYHPRVTGESALIRTSL